uniref:A2M domain-containing protein n=1 Tax=Panagrellus redivivus TaxID=6233 RepID=A0A7E4WDQ2_PANRE
MVKPNFSALYETQYTTKFDVGEFLVLKSEGGFNQYMADSPFIKDNSTAAITLRINQEIPYHEIPYQVTLIARREIPEKTCTVVARFAMEFEATDYCDRQTALIAASLKSNQSSTSEESTTTISEGNSDIIRLMKELDAKQKSFEMYVVDRFTAIESGIALLLQRFETVVDEMKKKKAGEIGQAIRRKATTPDEPIELIADAKRESLQDQIDDFIKSDEGKALNVSINGHCFYDDASVLNLASKVKDPRKLGLYVYQLLFKAKTLRHWAVGNLQTGKVANSSNRRSEPKKILNSEVNQVIGNIATLVGGCVVDDRDYGWWMSQIRAGLNGRGDSMYSSLSVRCPSINYIRVGGRKYKPAFSDLSEFHAPASKKVRPDEESSDSDN